MSAKITGVEGAIRVLGEAPHKTAKRLMIAVDREVTFATPVDTGRARASWLPSVDSPEFIPLPPGEYPAPSPKEWNTATTGRYYLTNNLAYINALNQGHSQQATAGFVQSAVLRALEQIK